MTKQKKPIKIESMRLLPPAPDVCQICAVKHDEDMAHNYQSIFYQMRFKMKHERDPTWADACAHLPSDAQAQWKQLIEEMAPDSWSDPEGGPIAEDYFDRMGDTL